MARFGFAVVFCTLLWVGVFAITPKNIGLLKPSDLIAKELESISSCYYNIFLTNYEQTGFGGATFTVQSDGETVDGFSSITLPDAMDHSGWALPVASGASVTLTYSGSDSHTGNAVLVTDANGNTLLDKSLDDVDSYTFTIDAVSCSCSYPSSSDECPSIRVRNEWRSLSYCDKALFMSAINALRNTTDSTGLNIYQRFIEHHADITASVAQRSLLLPWHRGFILKFEDHLRALGGEFSCIALPYWDASLDFGYEYSSSVGDDFGGISVAQCMGSPLEWWTDPYNNNTLHQDCVYRQVWDDDFTWEQFPTAAALDLAVVANSNYEYIFRYLARNPHKSVHIFLGGTMGSMATVHSPADPLFFLHHANIDRLYAMWQDCWDYDTDLTSDQYTPVAPTKFSTFVGIDEFMPLLMPISDTGTGNNVTVAQMLDITSLGYLYTPSTRNMLRMNTNETLTELSYCSWNWFNKTVHDSNGYSYRLSVHNTEQRTRLSQSRAAYKSYLEENPLGVYSAIKAQMNVECELNGGYTADDYNDWFMSLSDLDRVLGPGEMFKNACKLLKEGTLDSAIASCYPHYSCITTSNE